MEKDKREPVYTEQGYVYDFDEEAVPETLKEENAGEGASFEKEALYNEESRKENIEDGTGKGGGAKKFPVPLLTALFLLLGALGGAWAWQQMNRPEKIDLNRYAVITASGYDGYGRAEVSVDREALESDIAACLLSEGAIETGEGKSRLEAFRASEYYEEIMESISWSLDLEEDLSNGDTITLTISCEPEDQEGFGLAFRSEPVLYTVSGLEEVIQTDPFEKLTVTVSGTGPDGVLGMEWDDSLPWTYEASPDRGLSNGDEVLIRVALSDGMDERTLAGERGYALTGTEMSYRVEGLPSYAVSLSDLSEEISARIRDFAMEKVRQKVTEGYAPDENMTDLVPAGTLLVSGRGEEGNFYNEIFSLFRVSYSNRETSLDYYYYVRTRDLILSADGTWSLDEESCEYPMSLHGLFGLIDTGDYVRIDRLHAVTGFASPEDFYAACIEPLESACTVSGELE